MSRACPACGTEVLHDGGYCTACGSTLGTTTAGERRQVTFLFADMVNSTQLTRLLDPEELSDIMAAYYQATASAVSRYGGRVARFEGDGMVAFFGYPMAHEDAATAAIHAGRAIIDAVRQIHKQLCGSRSVELAVRAAVATGLVVTGATPGRSRLEDTSFVGLAPNLAARLQHLAAPDEIVVAELTRRIAGEAFVWIDGGMHVLKGFDDPIRIYRVAGEAAGASRLERRLGQSPTPMVDRTDELSTLLDRWDRVNTGKTQIVLISGDPGIGKSRLLRAFADRLAKGAPYIRLSLQCSPMHLNTALYPFVDLLQRMARCDVEDSPRNLLDRLRALLQEQGTPEEETLALLAALMSIPTGDLLPPLLMSPLTQRQRTFAVLIQWLVQATRRMPTLMVFEDLHWLDPTSGELLEKMIREVGDEHLLVLATTRPEARLAWATEDGITSLQLTRLAEDYSAQMVATISGNAELPEGTLAHIIAKTDGVPLFIEELTRMVLARRPADLPETLVDLLTEQLDLLGPARLLAQVGAVIGREFSVELAAAAGDITMEALNDSMERLLASGLVYPTRSRDVLMFKHSLVQDAAYDTILLRTRRQLHSRIADTIVSRFPALAKGEPEVVARHLTIADHGLEAARWWLLAGQQAIRRGAPREAVSHFEAGLETLARIPEDEARVRAELDLLAGLGPAHMVMKGPGHPDFGRVQRRAFETTRRLPDHPSQFSITYGLALFHWGRAELDHAAPLAEHLMETARSNPTAEHIMAAHNMNAMVKFHRGIFAEACRLLERSTGLYQPDSHAELYPRYMMDFGVFGRFYHGLSCFVAGYPDMASSRASEAVELAAQLSQPHSRGFAMLANFIISVFRRDPSMARRWAEECLPFAGEQGFPEFVALALIAQGWAQAEDGDVETGLATLESGYAQWKATGFENWQSWYGILRSDLLLMLGRIAEAQAEIEEQKRRIALSGEYCFASLLTSADARLMAACRDADPSRIEAMHRSAMSIAVSQEALSWELRCGLAFAAWLEQCGRIGEARTLLQQQLAHFSHDVITGDLRDARMLLRCLGGEAELPTSSSYAARKIAP
jgi:class 3 adenylate cyclase/predicted ATPase